MEVCVRERDWWMEVDVMEGGRRMKFGAREGLGWMKVQSLRVRLARN